MPAPSRLAAKKPARAAAEDRLMIENAGPARRAQSRSPAAADRTRNAAQGAQKRSMGERFVQS